MKKNLSEIKCDAIFIDWTYKIIPPRFKKYKFFVILGFDDRENRLFKNSIQFRSLCCSRFSKRTDFCRIIFSKSYIILCWFHSLTNIKNKISYLNSKNSTEK